MKTNFTKFTLIASLCVAGATTAYAASDSGYGSAAASATARTVNIDSGTKYLNVTRGETVTINAGGKSVTWKFDTRNRGATSFSLSKVIPEAGSVTVYVDEPYLGSTR